MASRQHPARVDDDSLHPQPKRCRIASSDDLIREDDQADGVQIVSVVPPAFGNVIKVEEDVRPTGVQDTGSASVAGAAPAVRGSLDTTPQPQQADITQLTQQLTELNTSDVVKAEPDDGLATGVTGRHSPSPTAAPRGFCMLPPLQQICWPVVWAGQDLLAMAASGRGRMLCYGLPLVHHLSLQEFGDEAAPATPRALVVSSSREVTVLVAVMMRELGSALSIAACSREHMDEWCADVVVSTLGCLQDVGGDCHYDALCYLVLDDLDRLCDHYGGHACEARIDALCSRIHYGHQTLIFSARWSTPLQQLATMFLNHEPVKVTVGSDHAHGNNVSHSIIQLRAAASEATRLSTINAFFGLSLSRVELSDLVRNAVKAMVGDATLKLHVLKELLLKYPDDREGQLQNRTTTYIDNSRLAIFSDAVGITAFLTSPNNPDKPTYKRRGTAVEALLGQVEQVNSPHVPAVICSLMAALDACGGGTIMGL